MLRNKIVFKIFKNLYCIQVAHIAIICYSKTLKNIKATKQRSLKQRMNQIYVDNPKHLAGFKNISIPIKKIPLDWF